MAKEIIESKESSEERKLRQMVRSGKLKKGKNSYYLDLFRTCDICPLRPKTETRIVNGQQKQFTKPGRCPNYNPGRKCTLDKKKFIDRLERYYDIYEKYDTLAVHEAVTFEILEDAQMARQTELLKNRQPGHYTHKFMELAVRSMESLNKQKFGEKHENTNHNIDWTAAVESVWEQRKNMKKVDDPENPN